MENLIVENLTKIYGNQKALNCISFKADKGEIVGFLGPNGAGKSTMMKIATGYIPASAGTVKICGEDVHSNPMEVKAKIGYLPEQNPLYPDMYIKEFLQFAGATQNMSGALLSDRVQEMIEVCGLQLEQHKKIGMLSKGYRQRTGLAQALIHDPEILILDEPTTGLDPNQLTEIRSLIKKVGRDKTIVFSTHIMQEVQAICDRVVIINRGNIVSDSTLSALKIKYGSGIIYVEFSNEIDESVLKQMIGVSNLKKLDNKYQLSAQKDIRQEISECAQKMGWNIIELKMEEQTLEDVFKKLTTADQE